MLRLRKFTKAIPKDAALFVLIHKCSILLFVGLFRASHASKDQYSNS